jgi:hypothetical protein
MATRTNGKSFFSEKRKLCFGVCPLANSLYEDGKAIYQTYRSADTATQTKMLARGTVTLGEETLLAVGTGIAGRLIRFGSFAATSRGLPFLEKAKEAIGVKGMTELESGLHHLNPRDIRFTQSDVSPFFNNGRPVSDLINTLMKNKVSPYDIPPIRVVVENGKLFSIDNRRLLAFNTANIDKIPVEIASLKDTSIARLFEARRDPIAGEGQFIAVVKKDDRLAAQELLREYGLIRRK